MEELEDDVIVIVVGDEEENEDGSIFPPIKIKEEILDETDGILTTFIPSDEPLIIKQEILDEDEHLFESASDLIPKEEVEEEPETYEQVEDEDYVPSDQEDDKKRFKLLGPGQRKSFVKDLKHQYPELAKDKELLVHSLAEIMRNVKPPPLPADYYVVNGIMLQCIICSGVTETIPAAGRHYQEKHGPRYLICFACGVDFRSTTNLYKHEKRCISPDAEIVLRARAIAIGNKARHRPYLQAKKIRPRDSIGSNGVPNNKKRYDCELCPTVFYSKKALESHMFMHNGVRPFQCNQCPTAYTSRTALSRHLKKHSGIKYICDHCTRPFSSKTALIAHLDTHLPYRKHCCDYCGRRFAQKYALLLHIDGKHLNLPPPCACQLCPKRFRKMSVLKAHMKKAHGMLLMTRKMFFKNLPTMSDTLLQQAKVILKSDEDNMRAQNTQPQTAEDINQEFLSYVEANCPTTDSANVEKNMPSVARGPHVRNMKLVIPHKS